MEEGLGNRDGYRFSRNGKDILRVWVSSDKEMGQKTKCQKKGKKEGKI